MDFAQLKSSLKTKIEPAYLLYGTDFFLLNKASSLIQAVWPDAEVSKFDATTSPDQVVATLTNLAFFTTHRIVIYTVEPKTNLAALKNYLANPVAGTVLILIDANAKTNWHLPQVTLVNCNPLPANIAIPLLARQIAPHQITQAAAQYLFEATGGDYSLIDNELTKLLAFYADLPLWDVPQLAPYIQKTIDYQIYELGSAILRRDIAAATQMWQYLGSTNHNDYAIFGGLVAQLRRAYYATATQGDENAVAKFLGCSPYAIKYSRRDFGKNPALVRACYQQALNLEYQIKSGRVTIPAAVSALIYR